MYSHINAERERGDKNVASTSVYLEHFSLFVAPIKLQANRKIFSIGKAAINFPALAWIMRFFDDIRQMQSSACAQFQNRPYIIVMRIIAVRRFSFRARIGVRANQRNAWTMHFSIIINGKIATTRTPQQCNSPKLSHTIQRFV